MRYRMTRLALLPTLFATVGIATATPPASGQVSDRFAVLVPVFTSQQNGKSNFGKDVAKEFNKLLADFSTHKPVDSKVLKDALRKFDVKEEALGGAPMCVTGRQLALQIDVQLVLCGGYEPANGGYRIETHVIAPAESETYTIAPFEAAEPKAAAQMLAQRFEAFIEGLQVVAYCAQYMESQNWTSAIENCNRAIETNPSKGTYYMRSYALWKSGETRAAYEGFQKVLEMDPQHQDALLVMGIVANELDMPEEGMKHFREYMSLNPGNRQVRLTVAGDAAKAGQWAAALAIVEDGLVGEDANDIDLLQNAGVFAMNAANKIVSAAGGTINAESSVLFEKSITHLAKVYDVRGSAMDVALVRNIVQANRLLDRNEDAIAFAARTTADPAYANDAGLWSVYADVLNKAGRQPEAFAALDKAESIEPDYAVNARRASWKLDMGDVAAAVPAIRTGLQKGEITPEQADVLGQKIAVTAFQKKAQAGQHQAALRDYEPAQELVSSALGKSYVAFFKAYSTFQIALEREKPENLATAQATLPMFREVISLMNSATAIPDNLKNNRAEIIDAAQQYVAIQEAIIKRGR